MMPYIDALSKRVFITFKQNSKKKMSARIHSGTMSNHNTDS